MGLVGLVGQLSLPLQLLRSFLVGQQRLWHRLLPAGRLDLVGRWGLSRPLRLSLLVGQRGLRHLRDPEVLWHPLLLSLRSFLGGQWDRPVPEVREIPADQRTD